MSTPKHFIVWIVVGFLALCLLGCAAQQPAPKPQALLGFDEAIQYLSNDLLNQLKKGSGREIIVIDPFVDIDSGQQLKINETIGVKISETFKARYDVRELTPENFESADYVLNGIISYEKNKAAPSGKAYRIYASIFGDESGKVESAADVWVSAVEYAPADIYADSPVYLREKDLESKITAAKTRPGDQVPQAYVRFLVTKALIAYGDKLYGDGQFEEALEPYTMAEQREDGKTLKVYAGLYNIHRRLGNIVAAEKAFGRLVAVSVEEYKRIDVKLLFQVNTATFIQDSKLTSQYYIWLRQIARYIADSPYCINIVGHSSRSGAEQYNEELSERRARAVQEIMAKTDADILKRSGAKGMGFRQNIVGTGADDESDAIDRRVEFVVVDCNTLPAGK